MSPSNANAIISQLMHAISHCDVVSNTIAIQLDNCAVNKNFTMLASFGKLLKWVPQLSKVK